MFNNSLSHNNAYAIGTIWSVLAFFTLFRLTRDAALYNGIGFAFCCSLIANLTIANYIVRATTLTGRELRQLSHEARRISTLFLVLTLLTDIPFAFSGTAQTLGIYFVAAFVLLIQGPALVWFGWNVRNF